MIAHKKRKCRTKYCRKAPADGRLVCQCCRLRQWRKENPQAAAWANHVGNAAKRGIAVLWSRAEFLAWAEDNGYPAENAALHIHRPRHREGYSLDNAQALPAALNSRIGCTLERWPDHFSRFLGDDESSPLSAGHSIET